MSVHQVNKSLSAGRKEEVDEAIHPENGVMSWSVYEVEKGEANSILSKLNQ